MGGGETRARRLRDRGDAYLIWRRPELRGCVSIGFLALVLLIGGKSGENQIVETANMQSQTHSAGAFALLAASRPEEPPLIPFGEAVEGHVTHYGDAYNGYSLGCGFGPYSSDDPTIVAVGPAREAEWPCGARLEVCGPGGCIVAMRKDGCPGCGPSTIDLSEAGLLKVCGPGTGACRARIQLLGPVPP